VNVLYSRRNVGPEPSDIGEHQGLPPPHLFWGTRTRRVFYHIHQQASSCENDSSEELDCHKEAVDFTKNGPQLVPCGPVVEGKNFEWSAVTCASSITMNGCSTSQRKQVCPQSRERRYRVHVK
jgi:hypothetical protein